MVVSGYGVRDVSSDEPMSATINIKLIDIERAGGINCFLLVRISSLKCFQQPGPRTTFATKTTVNQNHNTQTLTRRHQGGNGTDAPVKSRNAPWTPNNKSIPRQSLNSTAPPSQEPDTSTQHPQQYSFWRTPHSHPPHQAQAYASLSQTPAA